METELTNSGLKINKIEMIGKIIDYICLSLIGALSVGFLLFYSDFAKLHVDLAALHAPLFIGDFVFIICTSMFLLKWFIDQNKLTMVSYALMLYASFVIVKVLWGYFYWGSLALRHAVLFLYPLFAVFFYSFYRRSFFIGKKSLLIIFLFLLVFLFMKFHPYYTSSCFLLVLLLINKQPKFWVRLVLLALLLAIFPYKLVFSSQRTFIVSNFLSFLYFTFSLLVLLRTKARYRVLLCSLFLSLIIFGLVKYSNHNELKSLVGFEKLRSGFNEIMNMYVVKKAAFTTPVLNVKLYNEVNLKLTYSDFLREWNIHCDPTYVNSIPAEVRNPEFNTVQVGRDKVEIKISDLPAKSATKVPASFMPVVNMTERGIETPYSNSLFRIVIWFDALMELRNKLPIFGFDFGRPFRSRILEVCKWGERAWQLDGWVCLHNSYLDIIYRAGIAGILIIAGIFVVIFSLVRISLKRRTLAVVLLTGILLNWITAAFFMEIFEMPYSAIPLWSLFGLTSAYLFKNKAKPHEDTNHS